MTVKPEISVHAQRHQGQVDYVALGAVTSYDHSRGYGFVESDGFRYYVDHQDVVNPEIMQSGDTVRFVPGLDGQKRRAYDVYREPVVVAETPKSLPPQLPTFAQNDSWMFHPATIVCVALAGAVLGVSGYLL